VELPPQTVGELVPFGGEVPVHARQLAQLAKNANGACGNLGIREP